MNSKLLRVCAAIVLISGAGDVVSMDSGSEKSITFNEHPQSEGTSGSFGLDLGSKDFQVEGVLYGKIDVDFNGEKQKIELFTPFGELTQQKDRTITFTPSVNANYKITFEGSNGLYLDTENFTWVITDEKNRSKKVNVHLYLTNPSAAPGVDPDEITDTTWEGYLSSGEYSILFEPEKNKSIIGKFSGSLKIQFSANE